MLYSAARLTGLALSARDGMIGTVEDFLFDDREWTVRWVVVDTGTWLSGRSVLIPPSTLGSPDLEGRRLPVSLTREQIENSPSSETAQPLSSAFEEELSRHYGVPAWWLSPMWLGSMPAGSFMPGALYETSGQPGQPMPGDSGLGDDEIAARLAAAGDKPGIADIERNAHLRSVKEVTGYYIRATDDEIGHVEDFLIEDGSWAIRYMIVDTRNWLPGKRVLVSPRWIKAIDWADETVGVELSRRQIQDSPEWDPNAAVERSYEERLHGYYGLPGYWD